MENQDLLEALDFINPGSLTYEEWTMVGMGLKQAGFPVTSWEQWSAATVDDTTGANAPASGAASTAMPTL